MNHQDHQAQVMPYKAVPEAANVAAAAVVDAAIKVHRLLGPGLLESVYELCMLHELTQRGITVQSQVWLPVVYEDITLDTGLRLDLLVNGQVIVEIKAVEQLERVHTAQVLTYLKLSGLRLGLLINFNVTSLKAGIRRYVR